MIAWINLVTVQDFTSSSINSAGFTHTICMSMSVYVDAKTPQAVTVYRNVAKDHAVHHMVCTKFAKILSVLVITEDVVVAAD